jgi:hypothetical protein
VDRVPGCLTGQPGASQAITTLFSPSQPAPEAIWKLRNSESEWLKRPTGPFQSKRYPITVWTLTLTYGKVVRIEFQRISVRTILENPEELAPVRKRSGNYPFLTMMLSTSRRNRR